MSDINNQRMRLHLTIEVTADEFEKIRAGLSDMEDQAYAEIAVISLVAVEVDDAD